MALPLLSSAGKLFHSHGAAEPEAWLLQVLLFGSWNSEKFLGIQLKGPGWHMLSQQ